MANLPDTTYLLPLRAEPGEIAPESCIDCGEHHRVVKLADKWGIGWHCGGRTHRLGVLVTSGRRGGRR